MKRWKLYAVGAAILLTSGAAMAQSVPYLDLRPGVDNDHSRQNDPFVFCTEGVKNGKVWRVINPNTPMLAMIGVGWINIYPYCPWPSTVGTQYCSGWPQEDVTAWGRYVAICNDGGTRRDWKSRNGQGAANQTDSSGSNNH
ncbi:MAG: hypothetical protein JSR70_11630 [Proteobacteria bacterium]|nr:hypothetical protein [Pseudomonadota bacterium]